MANEHPPISREILEASHYLGIASTGWLSDRCASASNNEIVHGKRASPGYGRRAVQGVR